MKILCETQVVNRQTQANKHPRAVKSTLALGYKSSSSVVARDNNGKVGKELEMVLFTPQNKAGTRYKVSNNIEKVFNKFQLDGKATISFKQPPENVLIKCDPIQLKGFLQTLKLGMEGKDSINLRLNIAAASAIPQKSQPQQRMVVVKRSDYPLKGFPKSLKALIISNIQLQKLSFEICSLRYLTVLNVSNNNLTKLPPELGRLALTELFISCNSLGETNNWNWLKGITLTRSLRELDLTNNKLSYFPPPLIKYEQLVTLKLNINNLKRLPFGLRRMRSLRYLHVSTNKLESLPAIFDELRVDNLDIWGNNFQPLIEHNVVGAESQIPHASHTYIKSSATPLWLLAARAVCKYKLPYSAVSLPWLLVDLITELPKCACGKLCYASNIYERAVMAKFLNVKNMVFSRNRQIYEDIVLCSQSCKGRRKMISETLDPHADDLVEMDYYVPNGF